MLLRVILLMETGALVVKVFLLFFFQNMPTLNIIHLQATSTS